MTRFGTDLKTAYTRVATPFGVVAVLALAQGCAQAPNPGEATLRIDAETTQYVARFEQEAANHGRALSITHLIVEFGQLESLPGESGPRGECTVATGHTPVITLSRDAWDRSSDSEREELVFHELGHCVLGLAHQAGITSFGIPRSVMNPTEIDGAIYKQYRAFYLAGLFKK